MLFLKKKAFYIFLSVFSFAVLQASAQKESFISSLDKQNHWVDSVYNKLSRRQRVAQLFFVRAHTNLGQKYEDSVANVIATEQLGGVVFFQGGPVRQADQINRYQSLSKVPLLIAQDGEWGLGMRLDSTTSFPFQMTLGAVQDNTLIYKMGQQVAYDFKRMGMQMNFGPDMDINNNPDNPVINYRSFGDNKFNVAQKGIAYFTGMQSAGLLTTAKHFPGHGDTNVDSHLDLPLLPFTRQRLDTLEEYPFREAIKAGISGVMVAHMDIPALDNTKNLPSSLSRKIVTGILKDSLGFKGLVVSDALDMQGVVKYFPKGEADVRAFLAGNDVLELSQNSARAILLIRKAVRKDQISAQEFEIKVKKILAAKYWAGLNNYHPTLTAHLTADLNRPEEQTLIQQMSDAAVTLLKGNSTSLQLNPINRTAIVSIGVQEFTVFQKELSHAYQYCTFFKVGKAETADNINRLCEALKQYNQVYISINDSRARPQSKLDYSAEVKDFISRLSARPNTVVCLFANPYTMSTLPGIEKAGALICCYQMTDALQRSAVKVIERNLNPTGKLPVNVKGLFSYGTGIKL